MDYAISYCTKNISKCSILAFSITLSNFFYQPKKGNIDSAISAHTIILFLRTHDSHQKKCNRYNELPIRMFST